MNNNRVLLQSGKGIGGIFRFLSNILMPVFKKAAPVIKTYVKSDPVQRGLKKIRKKAVKSAINTASDVVAGRNPKNRLKKDMIKIANITSDTVLGNTSVKKKSANSLTKKNVYFYVLFSKAALTIISH